MKDLSVASLLFEADTARNRLEDRLVNAGLDFDSLSWDFYDNSLEIHQARISDRLSEEAQKIVLDAGFSKVYVNHVDKWETHYSFACLESSSEGWRVSYPHKRGPEEKGIWVESKPEKWPAEWFETGYAMVKEPSA